MPHSPVPRAQGFVLVLVLAMLVALSVLAGTVALVTERLRDDEFARQRAWQAERDMADSRASVLYLLLSQRMTFAGLTVDDQLVLSADERMEAERSGEVPMSFQPVGNEIRLDATPYRGLGAIDFALQDDRGLVSLNWAAPFLFQRLVEGLGGSPRPLSELRNLLLDYQDPDDLYRLGSAERAQYLEAGLAPPSNRTLATPLELRAVMGWRDLLAGMGDAEVLETFTTVRSTLINLNTAPERVLATLPGVDAGAARRLVDGRRLRPYTDLRQPAELVPGLPAESDLLSLYPAASGTLRMWPREGGQARVLHWTLTPLNQGGAPWREDYEYAISQDRIDPQYVARATEAAPLAEPVPAP